MLSAEEFSQFVLRDGDSLALDPGNRTTGWVIYRPEPTAHGGLRVLRGGDSDNRQLRRNIFSFRDASRKGHLSVECPKPRGQLASSELMDTLIEIGRFLQMWRGTWSYVHREDVKLQLCGTNRGITDANLRRAVLDRFGGESYCIGGKKCQACKGRKVCGRPQKPCLACKGTGFDIPPGDLCYAKGSHVIAAIGVACWWVDLRTTQHTITSNKARKQEAQ